MNLKTRQRMRYITLSNSYRSGLESRIADQIKEAGLSVDYETDVLTFHWPQRMARYTPDFKLPKPDGGFFFLEVKGRWQTADRQKMLLVRQQNPDHDIRMLFQRGNNRLYKGSRTTYGDWCDLHGILWCEKSIPADWLLKESDDGRRSESKSED